MKLILIFTAVLCMKMQANVFSQVIQVKTEMKNASIKEVLAAIESVSNIRFFYNDGFTGLDQKVNVSLNNNTLEQILKPMLGEVQMTYYQMDERFVVIAPMSELGKKGEKMQGLPVSGVVKDAPGNPMPGVNVLVKGTVTGVVTDATGKYSINVPNRDAVLVFSFIGYTSQELSVGDQTSINVSMAEDTKAIEEVVVVGYGSHSRRFLTSSVTTVKQSDMNKAVTSDLGQMLQGKVPGLNITKSGDPNRGSAIILRGASTLRDGAQSPLFVVDGIPGASTALIAPDDIVSMDVLKDAAATAIYGNRAANGVIIITTRKGQSGKLQISYNGYVASETVSNRYDMMSASQLKDYLDEHGQVLSPNDDMGADTNWQDEVQRNGFSQNHNLSFSGGTDKMTYNASLNYYDQQGILLKSGYKRYLGRLSMQQKAFNDRLELGLTAANAVTEVTSLPFRNVVLSQMLSYLPTAPVRNPDGSYYENFTRSGYINPIALIENATEEGTSKNFLGIFTAKANLPWDFTYNLNVSYQDNQSLNGSYYNSYCTTYYKDIRVVPEPGSSTGTYGYLNGENGVARRSTGRSTSTLLETYLNWDKTLGDHSMNVVLGYSYQYGDNDGLSGTSTNYPSDEVSYYNIGLGDPYAIPTYRIDVGGEFSSYKLISDFMRFNYNYKGRYLLQASLRHDGSSMLGDNYQWGWFPSIGVAWRIIQEGFMQNQSLLSDLKVRFGYGVTGNTQGFNPYSAKMIYGPAGSFYLNGQLVKAYGASQNPNPDLHWEKTATSNVGLDFALWGGRLSASVDMYEKITTDLIYNYEVSTSVYPHSTMTANVGEMSNKGVEFILNATPVQTKDFTWQTTLNIAHNKNKIVTLSNDKFKRDKIPMVDAIGSGQSGITIQILQSGMPIGQYYTFKYAGKNEDGVSQYYDHEGNITSDMSKLKTIEDYYYCGDAQPKALLGWVNSFKYKNIDLNFFFRSVLGAKVFNITRANLTTPNSARLQNIPVFVASESVNDYNSFRFSDRYIENASYLRLDNITLGYTFNNIAREIKQVRLYVTGNNLFVITPYKGIDPEINQGGMAPGVDGNNFYPKTRTIMFGVNASF